MLWRAAFDGYVATLPIDSKRPIYASAGLPIGLTLRASYQVRRRSAMRPPRRRDAKGKV